MSEFILEIGTEEMPARFVPRLGEELVELFERLLAEARAACGSPPTDRLVMVLCGKRIRIGVRDYYPLFAMHENDRRQGFEIDVAEAIADRLGVEADFTRVNAANRIALLAEDRIDLTIATMHVHLDHESCLEVAVLRGDVEQVRRLSEGVISQSGVRYGHTHVVPVKIAVQSHHHDGEAGTGHSHGPGTHAHEHIRTLVWNPKT